MKKRISLLLAFILALGIAPVLAQEAAAPETDAISWDNLRPEVEALGLTGDYYKVDGLQVAFWLPASLHPADLDADLWEKAEAVAVFETEDGGKAFLISLYPLEVETLAEFAEAVSGVDGARDCRALTVNGLSAYSFEADDCLFVSFFVDGGSVLSFNFSPVSNDVFNALARIIASSVQPYSGAEE